MIELKNILDNLMLKYIYNSPEEILNNSNHLLFQLQSSYWDYIDNYYSNVNNNLLLVSNCFFIFSYSFLSITII